MSEAGTNTDESENKKGQGQENIGNDQEGEGLLLITCDFCGKKGKVMNRCGNCKKSAYCDRECQKNDWKNHKPKCKVVPTSPPSANNTTSTTTTNNTAANNSNNHSSKVVVDVDEKKQAIKRSISAAEFVPTPEQMADAMKFKEQGNDYYKQGNYEIAEVWYTKAIEAVPNEATFLANRAAARMSLNKYSLALEDLEKAASFDPSNVKFQTRFGDVLLKLGKMEEAIKVYRKVNAKEQLLEAERNLQRSAKVASLLKQQLYEECILYANSALRISPNSFDLGVAKVECLMGLHRYAEAYKESTELMQSSDIPQTQALQFLILRAQCAFKEDNFSTAERCYEQVLKLDPDHRIAGPSLKRLRKLQRLKASADEAYKAGKYPEAIQLYTECAMVEKEQAPKGFLAKLHMNRALAYALLNQHEECVQDCDIAIGYDREYVKALHRRSKSLRVLGGKERLERALMDLKEVERLQGRSQELQNEIRQTTQELKVAKRVDYYAILELPMKEHANENDIKKAYKASARKWHPDRHASKPQNEKDEAEKQFKLVAEAYGVLSDPQKKAAYDEGADLEEIEHGRSSGGGMPHGVDPDDIFRMFFAQQQRGGGRGGHGHQHHYYDY